MELKEVIKLRRSIRKYKPDPVPEEILDEILLLSHTQYPSWKNKQCIRTVVVKNKDTIEEIAESRPKSKEWIAGAPAIVVLCAIPKESGLEYDSQSKIEYYGIDTGIFASIFMLLATNYGLGTCPIGEFDKEIVRKAIGVPDDIRIPLYFPVGYPAKEGTYKARKPIEEVCFHEQYGQRK